MEDKDHKELAELIRTMPDQQIAYCEFRTEGHNKIDSFRLAGYSTDTNLRKLYQMDGAPKIQRCLRLMRDRRQETSLASAKDVQDTLAAIMQGDVYDEILGNDDEIHLVKVHTRERIKASDVLASIQGIKNDTLHLKADQAVKIIDNLDK